MRLLITGFEPFGKHEANVSWQVAQSLASQPWAGVEVEAHQLPVSYDAAWSTLHLLLEQGGFDAVVMLGLASSRTEVCFERVAINVDDARLADNDGDCRSDKPIKEGGPAAYFTTIPIRNMSEAMVEAGFSAKISNTAGTFVCNHVLYRALDWASVQEKAPRIGFVHLPSRDGTELSREVALALHAMLKIM